MKRYIPFAMLLVMASCALQPIEIDRPEVLDTDAPRKVYHAATESARPDVTTKVSADQDMNVVWNAGDRISIFELTTYNHPYLFLGDDNDTAGDFEDQTPSGFHTGNRVPYVYAAYPYSRETKMDNRGDLTMNLPAEQSYKSNSFGIGANTMVAVSEGDFLAFKNVGGYISLRLYGDDVAVSSISLKANNGEKIAGKAKISIPLGGVPITVMDVTATDEVTIVCEPPVTIGTTYNDYTSFWFVIPPVTFSGGFTITVTDADGGIFTKSTSNPYVVTRNQLDWMNALKVIPDYTAAAVQFADPVFEAYCLDNFDLNEDGILTRSEARLVEEIDVCTDNISSLGGIECFTNLKTLVCAGSEIATRSGNSAFRGQLESIELGSLILLEELDCSGNQLEELDLSGNPNLQSVDCTDNPMVVIHLAPGQFITDLETPEDTQIVHDWDDGIGPASFPDPEFRAYVFDNFDTDHSGILSEAECNAVTSITVYTENVFSLEGIEFFQNLRSLRCLPYNSRYTGSLTSLDVSHNTALTELHCYNNQLTTLDVSNNTELTVLYCDDNQLTTLDVSNNTALTYLNCNNNQLTTLDVSNNTALTDLYCDNNQLTTLVSNNTALIVLNCHDNQLTTLDVSHNTALMFLNCAANQLTTLDVSNNTALKELDCSNSALQYIHNEGNRLTALDVSNNTALTYLNCDYNQLTALDVSNNTALTYLYCETNRLTTLVVSNNTALTDLRCSGNQLTILNVSYNTALTYLYCVKNQLTTLDVSNNTLLTHLSCWGNRLTSLDVSYNTALTNLDCNIYTMQYLYVLSGHTFATLSKSSNTTVIYLPEAVDLGLPSGLKWASFNLGAAAPEEFGDYYAWGETEPYYTSLDPLTWISGKEYGYHWPSYFDNPSWDGSTFLKYASDKKTTLDPEDDAAYVNLGGKFRTPTSAEWNELRTKCTWEWKTPEDDGYVCNGYLVTGLNSNTIFLPSAGRLFYDQSALQNMDGNYWSSSLIYGSSTQAWTFIFGSGVVWYASSDRYYGFPIRPVKD